MTEKKLSVGFFLNSPIAPSETFIRDLIKGLYSEKDINLILVKGKKDSEQNFNFSSMTINSGFSSIPYKLDKVIFKLGQLYGGKGFDFRLMLRRRFSGLALKKAKLPKLDIAYIDYSNAGILVMDYLKEKDIPFVVHVHGYDVTAKLKENGYKKHFEELLKRAEIFVVASQYIRKIMILNGCNEEKIKVIRLGVDTDKIVPMSWSERQKEPPSIVFLGRLAPKKHPIALIHAFNIVQKKIPDVKLTIIGDGPLRAEVEEVIRKLKLCSKINLLGTLDRDEAFPILNRHWIFAQHSVSALTGDQEGFAISLAEAAAHELPVVSTLHNGIPENVINEKTGILVPEFDFEMMAEKIIYLIENPDIAEKMGKAGRNHILQLCRPENRVEEIKKLMFEISR